MKTQIRRRLLIWTLFSATWTEVWQLQELKAYLRRSCTIFLSQFFFMNAHRKYGLEYDPATISLQNMGLLVGKSFRSEIGEGRGEGLSFFFCQEVFSGILIILIWWLVSKVVYYRLDPFNGVSIKPSLRTRSNHTKIHRIGIKNCF